MITHILNMSMAKQQVLEMWKPVNVGPVPKEANILDLNQPRPVSVTDIIMRVLRE